MNESPKCAIHDGVGTVTFQRSDKANRLAPEDLETLSEFFQEVNENQDVRVLLLRAQGKYFCSGYDIGQIGGPRKVDFEAVMNQLEDVRPVTIAALHGGVYGGGTDLALACDFRVGALATNMFMPAARLGLHFYQGGLERYVTRLGLDNAKRLFLTAEHIDAEEMWRIGFLTHLVRDGAKFEATVESLVQTCAAMAPLALYGMKRHTNAIARNALDVAALNADMKAAATSQDLKEGQRAWLEKRKPAFSGK